MFYDDARTASILVKALSDISRNRGLDTAGTMYLLMSD